MIKGCRTPEEAMEKFSIAQPERVWVYECMECGAKFYGQWHGKYTDPEFCPVCDCNDIFFIKNIGWNKK